MRKSLLCLSVLLMTSLAGCVTINVYFPKAAAKKAAGQFIDSVIDQRAPAGTQQQQTPSVPADKNKDKDTQGNEQEPGLAGPVLDFLIPAAHAQEAPNIHIHTPAVDAIRNRMQQRYRQSLRELLDKGVVGFTHDGMVAVRDASGIPLSRRAHINNVVAAANRDRKALYREIANANGHPQWAGKLRRIFAKLWIKKAHNGWYYQTAGGNWVRK